MIRVYKTPDAPLSLSTTQAYDGADVQECLEKDHHKKCYLCERRLWTEFQIEHHKSQENFPDLRQNWTNLFWSCGYCNGKKGERYDSLLDPVNENVEEQIVHELDFAQNKALFTPLVQSVSHDKTCEFLIKIHNGTKKIRTKREDNFFKFIKSVVTDFNRIVNMYLMNPTDDNCNLVRESLHVDQECLGFKYWIIRNHPLLFKTFANDIIWHKQ